MINGHDLKKQHERTAVKVDVTSLTTNEMTVAESITNEFCAHYGVTLSDLRRRTDSGKSLQSTVAGVNVSELRFALAHFLYVYSGLGEPKIVSLLGWITKASVRQAILKSKAYLDTNDLRFTTIYRQLISTVNKWYVDNVQAVGAKG